MSEYDSIDDALRQLDRRLRWLAAIGFTLKAVAVVGGIALLAALIDRVLPLPTYLRVGVLMLLCFGMVGGVIAAVTILARRFRPVAIARRAEGWDAKWGERLSTVVSQAALPAARRASPGLLTALTADVAREIVARPPVRLASPLFAWPGVMAAMLVAIAWAIAASFPTLELSRLVQRQWRPFDDVPGVTTTRIVVLPHPSTVRQGDAFSIAADITAVDGPVTIDVGASPGQTRVIQMRQEAGPRYGVTLLAVQRDFVYRIRAGDAVVGPVAVRVSRVPGVSELAVAVVAPDGRRRGVSVDAGVIFVPAGATCDLTLRATEPLAALRVRVGETEIAASVSDDRHLWRARFSATVDTPLNLMLTGESGIVANGPPGLRVSVLPATAAP